jgi:hypothetical protein
MQCFQKDPNLRVSARKLLRHAWIVGCRRSDAPVSKAPANFSQAVEEVKQWNKALKSSAETSLRASTGSDSGGPLPQGHPGSRFNAGEQHRPGATPNRGPLTLAKPRPSAEAFRSPELAGEFLPLRCQRRRPKRKTDDDNWDDDFASAISPSALHLPHLKPQDNFGGLLSADRLKAFASISDSRNESTSYDEDFEGELLTIKGPRQFQVPSSLEQTIRPITKKAEKTSERQRPQPLSKNASNKSTSVPAGPKSPGKTSLFGTKFELPARPDLAYREQAVEDYSDLFVDNDNVFSHKINPFVKKVL